MMLLQPSRRGTAAVSPAFYAPNAMLLTGTALPLPRANLLLLQTHDPIRSAEADYLSDAAAALSAVGGVADPVEVASEFTAMMAAVRAKATVDYSGAYRLDYIVQTPGAKNALAQMLRDYDAIYRVNTPDLVIYKGGVITIEWRIDGAGIYAP